MGCLRALLLLSALATSGCYIDRSAVKESELPATWQTALQERLNSPAAFAGVYENLGESRTRWMGDRGAKPYASRAFLWLPPNEDPRQPKAGRTVELIVVSPTQLKLVAREGAQVLNEEIRSVEWDAKDRAFVYGKDRSGGAGLGGHGAPGAGVEWTRRRLFKGADGCLYEQWFTETDGLGLFVLPVSTTTGDWSQWKPVAAGAR